jgi:hypothetical protein
MRVLGANPVPSVSESRLMMTHTEQLSALRPGRPKRCLQARRGGRCHCAACTRLDPEMADTKEVPLGSDLIPEWSAANPWPSAGPLFPEALEAGIHPTASRHYAPGVLARRGAAVVADSQPHWTSSSGSMSMVT